MRKEHEYDPLLGRVRGSGQPVKRDLSKPEISDGKIALPVEKYPEWAAIVSVFRHELSRIVESGDASRDSLSVPQAFYDFSIRTLKKNPQWIFRDDQLQPLIKDLYNELFGYGAIGLYLEDPYVEDILLNNFQWMDIVRNGTKEAVKSPFNSEEEVKAWLKMVFDSQNKELNHANPSENGMLTDGSRLFGFTYPISPFTGFAIRKHKKEIFQKFEDYIETNIAPVEFFQFLDHLVKSQKNMVISGATGSGKTTFVNFAASLVPHEERIITLEDTAELQIQHPRVLPLHTYEKGARAGDTGEKDIPLRDLLRYSLRLRPDRIIVGEVRDSEAFEMLDTLNTGHPGSFTTLHANSPVDAVTRLQTMAIRHSVDFPIDALRDLISQVIDVIIQIRNINGKRRVYMVEQVMFKHHFSDELFNQIEDKRKVYDNLYMRTLWKYDPSADLLNQVSQFILPDLS